MRKAPLYKEYKSSHSSEVIKNKKNYHKGLWFDRFFNRYYYNQLDSQDKHNWQLKDPHQEHRTDNEKEQPKKDWIDRVISGECGVQQALKHHAVQYAQLCQSLKGQQLIAKNSWNFAIGMGNNHPVENGFSWHPTLGTPYLTGAAVKGLLRTWVEVWSGLESDKIKQKCHSWFGSEEKFPDPKTSNEAQKNQAGLFIFFDALPIEPVKLSCDIMTPHMGEWYSQGDNITAKNRNDSLPADWHSPNPIAFLVVKEICLQFCIAPRPCLHPKQTEALVEAMKYLKMALEFLGAGAKTAVGYGRFEEDIQKTKQVKCWLKDKRLSQMSVKDAFRKKLLDSYCYKDQKIEEDFGIGINKTRQFYIEKNICWEEIIEILLEEKITLIQTWETLDKNTVKAKAYRKLSPYFPHFIIYLDKEKSEQVSYCQLSKKRLYDSGQVEHFAIDDYPRQTIKPVKVLVIGTKQSAWYSFLSTWCQQIMGLELDDIEILSDAVFELMEAEEDQSMGLSTSCLSRLNEYLDPYNLVLCFDSSLFNQKNPHDLSKEIQDFMAKFNIRNLYDSHTG